MYWNVLCAMLARQPNSTDFFHDRTTASTGAFGRAAHARTRLNKVDSSTWSRMYVPLTTSTRLSTKGTRQTHCAKACGVETKPSSAMNPDARITPIGPEALTKEAKKPRLAEGAFSSVSDTAFMYSPPKAKPCTKRSATSAIGARRPIE